MQTDALTITVGIVESYLRGNLVGGGELPDLIRGVYEALTSGTGVDPNVRRPTGHVSVLKVTNKYEGVTGDHLVCQECNRSMKMLKNHLCKRHNLTPEQYRRKWSLADDYPMISRDYAAERSRIAKENGLGIRGSRWGSRQPK